MTTQLFGFKGNKIRQTLHNGEWWFSVVDLCSVLADSVDAEVYWQKLKQHLKKEGSEVVTNCRRLELSGPDGKIQQIDCANTEGVFRIIQSIRSPKAESFKRWLAKVGYGRVQETEDPELATKRTRAIYQSKGYSKPWIEKRMYGIAVHTKLTDEWNIRGVHNDPELAILSAEISTAAFGMTPNEYRQLKGLQKENLFDHMTDLELIFSILGEAATTEIVRKQDAQGFNENKTAARKGCRIAGEARERLESETGKSVATEDNYLNEPESRKRLKHTKQGRR